LIVVLDDKAERIFEQKLSNATVVQKKFVFDQVATKSVTFMIFSNDRIISEEKVIL
jgi:hypothetical protein